jgi:hypothetical protein
MFIGLEIEGIMLPRQDNTDKIAQHNMLATFVLALKPESRLSFQAFISRSHLLTASNAHASWSDRLTTCIGSTKNPVDIAETLKFILRRVDASPTSTPPLAPLLGSESYMAFSQDERVAGYPMDAYSTLFLSRLSPEIGPYFDEMFEVWAAIAVRGEENHMTGEKLCFLLGWWSWEHGKEKGEGWEAFYEEWRQAGRRMEHLFLAWIRFVQQRLAPLPANMSVG